MTLLKTEILVVCPKDNVKVKADRQCAGWGKDPPRCRHFKHLIYPSFSVEVCCVYPKDAEKDHYE